MTELDEWIHRLIDTIHRSTPPGPARDALERHVEQLVGDYERAKREQDLLAQSAHESYWNKQRTYF
jgi:hypothetical protein